jgi:hypothetical protein
MAHSLYVHCDGCSFYCFPIPLTREYLIRLAFTDVEVFKEIKNLSSIYVYCPIDETYKLFKFIT